MGGAGIMSKSMVGGDDSMIVGNMSGGDGMGWIGNASAILVCADVGGSQGGNALGRMASGDGAGSSTAIVTAPDFVSPGLKEIFIIISIIKPH